MTSFDPSASMRRPPSYPAVPSADSDRDDVGRTYCAGIGVEIGAGARPTQLHADAKVRYADKRSDDELKAYFSVDDVVRVESLDSLRGQTFDFLIAHHVLEHCANVIETLIEWIALIRDGGILYLSLPNHDTTPDFLRLRTPPAHFLLDYLYRNDDDDFESREHIAGFLWSWFDVGGLEGKSKQEAAMSVHQALHAERNDLHWHTFGIETVKFVVRAAAELSGRETRLLFAQDGYMRGDEHRVVFRIVSRSGPQTELAGYLQTLRKTLRETVDRYVLCSLNGAVVHSLSAGRRGVPMLVECGALYPVEGQEMLEMLGVANLEPVYFEPGPQRIGDNDEALQHYIAALLAPRFARRLRGFIDKPGARLSISQALGAAPTLHIEIFNDPFTPFVEEMEIVLPVLADTVNVFEWILAALHQRQLCYVVLDDMLGTLPDLVRTLGIALAALSGGGRLLIGVKDPRRSQNSRRSDSNIGDVIVANEAKLMVPSRAMRLIHYVSVFREMSEETLAVDIGIFNPAVDTLTAMRMATDDNATERVECFVFTPASMGRLLDSLSRRRLPDIGHFDILENSSKKGDFMVDIALKSL